VSVPDRDSVQYSTFNDVCPSISTLYVSSVGLLKFLLWIGMYYCTYCPSISDLCKNSLGRDRIPLPVKMIYPTLAQWRR